MPDLMRPKEWWAMTVRKVYKLSAEAIQGEWQVEHSMDGMLYLRREGKAGTLAVHHSRLIDFFQEKEIQILMSAKELKDERDGRL